MNSLSEILLQWGYLGLFIGAALPLSADLLIIGFLALGGDPLWTIVATTLGNWTGGMIFFGLGRLGKWEWLEKHTRIRRESMERYHERVEKYGAWFGLATGLPFIGDIVAVALGFFRVHILKTAPFMLLGKAIRFLAWTVLFLLVFPASA